MEVEPLPSRPEREDHVLNLVHLDFEQGLLNQGSGVVALDEQRSVVINSRVRHIV